MRSRCLASCYYFTIRLKEEALGQLTKKSDRSSQRQRKEKGRGTERKEEKEKTVRKFIRLKE